MCPAGGGLEPFDTGCIPETGTHPVSITLEHPMLLSLLFECRARMLTGQPAQRSRPWQNPGSRELRTGCGLGAAIARPRALAVLPPSDS